MALLDNMTDPDRWQRLLADLVSSGVSVDPSQSGGFNRRNIAGTNTPSQHAFGRAMDVNWRDNPRGENPAGGGMDDPTRQFNVLRPDVAREVAGRHGMTWGGDWQNPDPMHFEMNRAGPVPLRDRNLIAQAGVTSPGAPPAHPPPPSGPLGLPQGLLPSSGPASLPVTPQAMPHTQGPETPSPMGAPGGGLFRGLGDFGNRLVTNPAFMAGLSILGTQPGGNWGPAGAQGAATTVQSRIRQSEFERQEKQRGLTQRIWGEAFPNGQPNPNHPLLRGVPPDMAAMVHAMGPEQGLEILGKLTMTRSTAQMQADLQRQLRQAQVGDLERLFAGQGGQQTGQQPGVAVQPPPQPGMPPQQMLPPQAAQPPRAPQRPPQQPPQQSGLPPILSTPGVRESMLGSMLLGDNRGAFDAYNAEVGRRRAPEVAAATTLATEEAKTQAGRGAARTQLSTAMNNLDRLVSEARAIRGDKALPRIVGIDGKFPIIPGTARADVAARLETLRSQIGLSVLQALREASKTGGAVGSVSNQEHELLQNNLAALSTSQSAPAFQRSLDQIIEYAERSGARLRGSYEETYGPWNDPAGPPAGGGGGRNNPADPLGIRR